MTRQELAAAIFKTSHLTGSFRLRSGQFSDHYFDKYRFESDPQLLKQICLGMRELIPADVDMLAGLELGGVPIATVLSQLTGLPTLFVRKAAKEYGTCQIAEGGSIDGARLLIVEDVITSGGQVQLSAAELRERGAVVTDAICTIDREQGGREKLSSAGIHLQALFLASELEDSQADSRE